MDGSHKKKRLSIGAGYESGSESHCLVHAVRITHPGNIIKTVRHPGLKRPYLFKIARSLLRNDMLTPDSCTIFYMSPRESKILHCLKGPSGDPFRNIFYKKKPAIETIRKNIKKFLEILPRNIP